MPKKSKKSAEAEAPSPIAAASAESSVNSPVNATPEAAGPEQKPKRKTAAKKSAASKLPTKKTAVLKKPAKKANIAKAPADPQPEAAARAADVEAEIADQAAIVAEDAMEANGPSEVLTPQPISEAAKTPDATPAEPEEQSSDFEPEPRPPAKLERLQKILAQAGIASRRHAEELITEGRVQVNGQIVTTLGSKADAARDHIRVDGKLLHGAERHRYFMLNKPRGYVTTVSDPEGRPTVMEFFKKAGERLYPVGRLDYLSEGLLLVTNDGELANKLTRAASGVEKTYLVKVSGQPTEDEIDRIREGVRIDIGKPGEGRVQTSPARIRQVRIGENPWYEVVLIEGRNRELRKMFEEIGHFVEKIRRVGYGPLVLDLEPGQMRELDDQELNLLRLAADGKWKPKKIKTSAMLPKQAGRTVDLEAGKRRPGKPFLAKGMRRGEDKPFQPAQTPPPQQGDRRRPEGRVGNAPAGGANLERPGFKGLPPRAGDQGQWRDAGPSTGRPAAGAGQRAFSKPPSRSFTKPTPDRVEGRGFSKPPANRGEGRSFPRPPANRGGDGRSFSRPQASGSSQRPFRDRPTTGGTDKPRFGRPAFPARPRADEGAAGFGERKPFQPRPDRAPNRTPGRARIAQQPVPQVVLLSVPRGRPLADKAPTVASVPGPPGQLSEALAEIGRGRPRAAAGARAKASAPGPRPVQAANQRSPRGARALRPLALRPGLRQAGARHLPPPEFRVPEEQDRLPAARLEPALRVADREAGHGREADRGPASKANRAGAARVVARTEAAVQAASAASSFPGLCPVQAVLGREISRPSPRPLSPTRFSAHL